ncbi:MAG: hypothetical protein KDK38_12525 [Leptospiraceae bacterium]|nr:hypothetical protein [Leptospiraceae bacterium]
MRRLALAVLILWSGKMATACPEHSIRMPEISSASDHGISQQVSLPCHSGIADEKNEKQSSDEKKSEHCNDLCSTVCQTVPVIPQVQILQVYTQSLPALPAVAAQRKSFTIAPPVPPPQFQ